MSTYQWGKAAGVTHAFVPSGEGMRSVCARVRAVTVTEPGGLPCGPCQQAVWWYERTGHADYLTPHAPNFDTVIVPQSSKPPFLNGRSVQPTRQPKPKPTMVPLHEVHYATDHEAEAETPDETQQTATQEVAVVSRRPTEPESIIDYVKLPYAEQRYWAPVMLAKLGTPEVWDQAHESAEGFQDRCYEQLVQAMKA